MDTQSDTLATAAGVARSADREPADALDRPRPTSDDPSARYLAELRHRARLSRDREDALVAAAKDGDAAATERPVETFLPRYGLDGEELSRREIAERLGVSVSRVRDIERRALAKLAVAAGGEEAA